jgi:hypothetical protein
LKKPESGKVLGKNDRTPETIFMHDVGVAGIEIETDPQLRERRKEVGKLRWNNKCACPENKFGPPVVTDER